MSWIPANHFNTLKGEIHKQSGIEHILSGDCKRLSLDILKRTNKRISETTLKRIYGFASTRYNPSAFTLNSLAEYCGHSSWADFVAKAEPPQPLPVSADKQWERLTLQAQQITNCNLQVLKNRSGIPFKNTIPRKFLTEHLAIFLNENYRCTVITAPSGYGKTIGLCHWIDDFLKKNEEKGAKDIVLLLSGSALISGINCYQDICDWIMGLYGLTTTDGETKIPEMLHASDTSFFLVIDGLDNHFNHHQFNKLFNQIIELLTLYRGNPQLKVIITMRTCNWNAVKHDIEQKHEWFTGFMQGYAGERNVPLLDYHEILEITGRVHFNGIPGRQMHLLENLTYPLFLQYFYDNHYNEFLLEDLTELSLYELVDMQVFNKIYLSNNSYEKVLLLTELIDQMDLLSGDCRADKLPVNQLLKRYHKAYHELLDIGYLVESNESTRHKYELKICFGNPHYLSLALAKKLLDQHDNRFNEEIIDSINGTIAHSIRCEVTKWVLYLCLSDHHYCSVRLIHNLLFTAQEKLEITSFLSSLLQKQLSSSTLLPGSLLKDMALEHFFGLEFLQSLNDKPLEPINNAIFSAKENIMMHTCIAIAAILQLNLEKLHEQIVALRKFTEYDYAQFPIHPKNGLETVYYYLKHGVVQKHAFKDLIQFYHNEKESDRYDPCGFTEVLFLFATYMISIIQDPRKSFRMLKAVKYCYPTGSEMYHFLLNCLTADTFLQAGDTVSAISIIEELENRYADENSRTLFMNIALQSARIKQQAIDGSHVQGQLDELMDCCDKHNYKLHKVCLMTFLLAETGAINTPSPFKVLYYDLVKTVRGNGCRVESFLTGKQNKAS